MKSEEERERSRKIFTVGLVGLSTKQLPSLLLAQDLNAGGQHCLGMSLFWFLIHFYCFMDKDKSDVKVWLVDGNDLRTRN